MHVDNYYAARNRTDFEYKIDYDFPLKHLMEKSEPTIGTNLKNKDRIFRQAI